MSINQIISIEGNIGSGKSTLLHYLREEFKNNKHIIFLKEPVDEWDKIKDTNGITILEKFYADQEKYSFSFQIMAFISRLSLLKNTIKQNPNSIIITERSLYTDKMVFAKMLYDSGKIEHINYQIYLNWFNEFICDFPVNKIIYVKALPEICFNRIELRARVGENNIPIDYLTNCHEYHEDMINSNICDDKIVLDGNINIYENKKQLHVWIKDIKQFIAM